jgi:hypothetical protein
VKKCIGKPFKTDVLRDAFGHRNPVGHLIVDLIKKVNDAQVIGGIAKKAVPKKKLTSLLQNLSM